MILHLGVLDLSYGDVDAGGADTTGKVAEELEARYHVMRIFSQQKMDLISKTVTESLDRTFNETSRTINKVIRVEDVMLSPIESSFRDFINSGEIESHIGGPTQAAQEGISHRFVDVNNKGVSAMEIAKGTSKVYKKIEKMKRKPRPSFVDTGLYVASFKAWLTR